MTFTSRLGFCSVYWFSIAVVINYCKLSGLKQSTRIILLVLEVRSLKWTRMGQNQGVGRRAVLQDLFSCLVQFSRPCAFLDLRPPSTFHGGLSPPCAASLWPSLSCLPLLLVSARVITLALPGLPRIISPAQGQLISTLHYSCSLHSLF